MKRIPESTRKKAAELRREGLSYAKIAKRTKISMTSVIKIIKEDQVQNDPVEAQVKKMCPNPRLMIIYFGQIENDAKCIIRQNDNYPLDSSVMVKRVLESEEPLYRLA